MTARISARNSSAKSSSVAGGGAVEQCGRALLRAQLDALLAQRGAGERQERRGDVGVDEQRLGRVAGAGPLRLGVEDDPQRVVEVGARVDVDVAVARRRVDDRYLGDLAERLLQPLAAARDDQVDDALLGGELGELLAAAGQ